MQLAKALGVIAGFILVVFLEACAFEVRWRAHEDARFTMGTLTVCLASLIGIYIGVPDGIEPPWDMYFVLFCVFGLFGLGAIVKWTFQIGRNALLNLDGLEGGGNNGRGSRIR